MRSYVTSNNPLKSSYIFLKTIEKPFIKQSLIFLTGYPYASSPGSLMIISIDNFNNVPKIVFNEEEFSLSEIIGMKDSSNFQIIGRKSYSQGIRCDETKTYGIDCYTYDPYSVYELVMENSNTSFKINYDLSKKYNEINYCGWEGIDSTEDIFVVHFKDGRKCKAVKKEEFNKVFKKQF